MATSTGIISNYLENRLLNYLFGLPSQSFTMPTVMYLSLYTSVGGAGDGNTGSELHQSITHIEEPLRPTIDIAAGALALDGLEIYNTEAIIFEQAVRNWGTVTGWGLMDSPTHATGNLLFWGMFDTPVSNPLGNTFKIDIGKLRMIFSQPTWSTPRGGWTIFSSTAMADWVVNGNSIDYLITGANIALGRNVIVDNTTNNLFSSWIEINIATCPSYSRKNIISSNWSTPSDGTISNITEVVFTAQATEAWGSITDVVLYDISTGTKPIFWGHLESPITVLTNDGFAFPIARLSVTLR
jgi:hypothetical protein